MHTNIRGRMQIIVDSLVFFVRSCFSYHFGAWKSLSKVCSNVCLRHRTNGTDFYSTACASIYRTRRCFLYFCVLRVLEVFGLNATLMCSLIIIIVVVVVESLPVG